MTNIQHDFFNAMSSIVAPDIDADEIDAFMNIVKALPTEQRIAFEASRFLAREAILIDEPRLFYASFAMLAMSGMGEPILQAAKVDSVSDVMDLAERVWTDTKQVAEQAMNTIVDKMVDEMGE